MTDQDVRIEKARSPASVSPRGARTPPHLRPRRTTLRRRNRHAAGEIEQARSARKDRALALEAKDHPIALRPGRGHRARPSEPSTGPSTTTAPEHPSPDSLLEIRVRILEEPDDEGHFRPDAGRPRARPASDRRRRRRWRPANLQVSPPSDPGRLTSRCCSARVCARRPAPGRADYVGPLRVDEIVDEGQVGCVGDGKGNVVDIGGCGDHEVDGSLAWLAVALGDRGGESAPLACDRGVDRQRVETSPRSRRVAVHTARLFLRECAPPARGTSVRPSGLMRTVFVWATQTVSSRLPERSPGTRNSTSYPSSSHGPAESGGPRTRADESDGHSPILPTGTEACSKPESGIRTLRGVGSQRRIAGVCLPTLMAADGVTFDLVQLDRDRRA